MEKFQNDIKYALNGCDNNINKYQQCFIKVLHTQAPLKSVKYIRVNQKPHLTKTLRKATMKDPGLR